MYIVASSSLHHDCNDAIRYVYCNVYYWMTNVETTGQRMPQDRVKGTNPALKKPSNIPEIYAKMFGRIH